ncbi:MAG TPA: hypothetical protein PJ994_03235 [Tepidiformaceae bacterium]|nr:hypothetical protein [Tepidiformaceae bacterium]
MSIQNLPLRAALLLALAFAALAGASAASPTSTARAQESPVDFHIEPQLDGSQFIYVVFHALDRGGWCATSPGAVSLHPVLGIPVDFVIESGEGRIIETSNGPLIGRSANDVLTFPPAQNAASANPRAAFPPLVDGVTDECQAWIRVSQSIPGPLRVLVTVAGDDGRPIGFIADLARTTTVEVNLQFRWNLVTWLGADGITPGAALTGAGGSADISSQVTAIYGWDAATQTWQAYFPAGAGVPGANNLTQLRTGQAYWVAIGGPGDVTWRVPQPVQ